MPFFSIEGTHTFIALRSISSLRKEGEGCGLGGEGKKSLDRNLHTYILTSKLERDCERKTMKKRETIQNDQREEDKFEDKTW